MKRSAILIAALAGVLLASHAQAQQPGQSYFGVGYGAVTTDGASPYVDTVNEGTAGAARIYAGSMGNGYFGMELGYYDLGKYDVNYLGAKIAESKAAAITVAGVLATPIGGGYTFHARAGIAFTEFQIDCISLCGTGTPPLADTKKRGVAGVVGLGLGAQLGRNVTVRMDYDHFGSVHHQVSNGGYKKPYDMLSVNLQFNF